MFPQVRSEQVFVDCTTPESCLAQEIAEAGNEHQAFFLDAPISGGAAVANRGGLFIIVRGEASPFETLRKFFDVLGNLVVHKGLKGYE